MDEEQYSLSPEESKQVSEAYLKQLGTKWLWFYTYIRMPSGILGLLGELGTINELAKKDALSLLVSLMYSGLLILLICNIVGLSRRTAWGYKLNWCVLAVECLVAPFSAIPEGSVLGQFYFLTYSLVLAIVLLIWLLPNVIYFRKRKHLFS